LERFSDRARILGVLGDLSGEELLDTDDV